MKMRKTTAFYIEALFITLFLLASCAILLKMFAAARDISERAKISTNAVIIAQNVSEQYAALLSNGESLGSAAQKLGGYESGGNFTVYYSADGVPAAKGEYRVTINTDVGKSDVGSMYTIKADVCETVKSDDVVFKLATKRFVPNE